MESATLEGPVMEESIIQDPVVGPVVQLKGPIVESS